MEINSLTGEDYSIIKVDNHPEIEKRKIYLFNKKINRLYTYNAQSGKIEKWVDFPRDGPEGTRNVSSFALTDSDTILLLSNQRSLLTIYTKGAKFIDRLDFGQHGFTNIFDQPGQDLGLINNKVIANVSGDRLAYESGVEYPPSAFLTYDLSADSLEIIIPYPKIYEEAIWGYNVSIIMNYFDHNSQLFWYSYPIDDSVYSLDKDFNIKSYYAGVNHADSRVPLTKPSPSSIEEIRIFFGQMAYHQVFTDHSGNIYRLIRKGISEEDWESDDPIKSRVPEFEILIANQDNEVLGVFPLEHNTYQMLYPFGDKILSLRKSTQQESENHITFDVYEFRESGL
ncbi:DUF4221 family protein [Fulvivirgaceae bacterium LMO-SS25]